MTVPDGYQLPGDQLPKPTRRRLFLGGLLDLGTTMGKAAVIVAVVVVLIVVVAVGARPSSTSVPSGGQPNGNQPAAAPETLLRFSGEGIKTSQTFDAPNDWQIDYTYDCSGFFNGQGNFQIYVTQNGLPLVGANVLGSGGSDTTFMHSGGPSYIEVNSECSWSLTAHT